MFVTAPVINYRFADITVAYFCRNVAAINCQNLLPQANKYAYLQWAMLGIYTRV